MIIYRNWKWIRYVNPKAEPKDPVLRMLMKSGLRRYIIEGWFLLGIIPLYIKIVDLDLPKTGGQ